MFQSLHPTTEYQDKGIAKELGRQATKQYRQKKWTRILRLTKVSISIQLHRQHEIESELPAVAQNERLHVHQKVPSKPRRCPFAQAKSVMISYFPKQ